MIPEGRTRLAPTPSGYLHRGNAINFLITYALAKAGGARLALRIDDLDLERVRPEYIEDIFRSLEWLGIPWDEGPSGPDDHQRNWTQALRVPRYLALVEELRTAGHLYACACSRSDRAAIREQGKGACPCRESVLPWDTPDTAWRLRLPGSELIALPQLIGDDAKVDLAKEMVDPVLRQRNGRPSYQVGSLADDLNDRTTLIVRGEDLLPSSACQRYMAQIHDRSPFLGVRFLHHPLELDKAHRKLSKSAGASSLKAMREAGLAPDDLRRRADRVLEEQLR